MAVRGSAATRLRMRLNREEGLKALDKAVLDYGFVEGEPFSFEHHEYQIEIIKDTSQRISVRKCSQVGLSELMVQKTLATAALIPNIRIIFTLPTKEMAMSFSKDRFDNAILNSDHYSGLMAPGANGASQKKIGESMLYVGGTFGANAAISIPAEIIISDEVDFSNPTVLGKLNSRIRHARTVDEFGQRGFRSRFSTPTFHGYGIDIDFQKGDQRHYMCQCKHCNTWVLPSYESDMILPGYEGKIMDLRQEHVESNRFDLDKAYIQCSHCKRNLYESLMDPTRRKWVAMITETLPERSYQVHPWDVPLYNTAPAILRQISDYPLKSDFMNFVIGLPYSDAENTFMVGEAYKRQVSDVDMWIFRNCIIKASTVGGMDVGKTCHLTVLARVGPSLWHAVWMEKIVNTKANPATPEVLARYDFYRMVKLCIDAGPDITLVNLLLAAREGITSVVYVPEIRGPIPIAEKMDGDVINADRTKTLTLTMNRHNAGEIHYPHRDDVKNEVFDHLETTKKLREKNPDGTFSEKFIKTSKVDHWVHSLNYANIATLACDLLGLATVYHAVPSVGSVKVGGTAADKLESDKKKPQNHVLKGLFGMSQPRKTLR